MRELRAFQKVELKPGESRTVCFTLDKKAFAHWDAGVHAPRVFGGSYHIEICANAQEVLLRADVCAEHEYIPDGRSYDLMSPIGEVMRHPAGKEFFDCVMPRVNAIVERMGMGKEKQALMPYADQIPRETGLMSEPLQTVKRMLSDISEEEWSELFAALNADASPDDIG